MTSMIALITMIDIMPNITIRDLPNSVKEALRIKAAQSGMSLESYSRHILQKASEEDAVDAVKITDLALNFFGKKNGLKPSEQISYERSSKRPDLAFEE